MLPNEIASSPIPVPLFANLRDLELYDIVCEEATGSSRMCAETGQDRILIYFTHHQRTWMINRFYSALADCPQSRISLQDLLLDTTGDLTPPMRQNQESYAINSAIFYNLFSVESMRTVPIVAAGFELDDTNVLL
ncbi:hypothetical protein B0H19DRAFT_1263462 [Mycena capillaripes]|nr:hypothetical protein B0H19DRAFT_1263462 [Mycena capillaripes]